MDDLLFLANVPDDPNERPYMAVPPPQPPHNAFQVLPAIRNELIRPQVEPQIRPGQLALPFVPPIDRPAQEPLNDTSGSHVARMAVTGAPGKVRLIAADAVRDRATAQLAREVVKSSKKEVLKQRKKAAKRAMRGKQLTRVDPETINYEGIAEMFDNPVADIAEEIRAANPIRNLRNAAQDGNDTASRFQEIFEEGEEEEPLLRPKTANAAAQQITELLDEENPRELEDQRFVDRVLDRLQNHEAQGTGALREIATAVQNQADGPTVHPRDVEKQWALVPVDWTRARKKKEESIVDRTMKKMFTSKGAVVKKVAGKNPTLFLASMQKKPELQTLRNIRFFNDLAAGQSLRVKNVLGALTTVPANVMNQIKDAATPALEMFKGVAPAIEKQVSTWRIPMALPKETPLSLAKQVASTGKASLEEARHELTIQKTKGKQAVQSVRRSLGLAAERGVNLLSNIPENPIDAIGKMVADKTTEVVKSAAKKSGTKLAQLKAQGRIASGKPRGAERAEIIPWISRRKK